MDRQTQNTSKLQDSKTPDLPRIVPRKMFMIDDFTIIRELGRGSFGQVNLVQHKTTKRYFALKCLMKESIRGKKQIQHIKNERDILQKFDKDDFCCNILESL